jgi:hypothetical protein
MYLKKEKKRKRKKRRKQFTRICHFSNPRVVSRDNSDLLLSIASDFWCKDTDYIENLPPYNCLHSLSFLVGYIIRRGSR